MGVLSGRLMLASPVLQQSDLRCCNLRQQHDKLLALRLILPGRSLCLLLWFVRGMSSITVVLARPTTGRPDCKSGNASASKGANQHVAERGQKHTQTKDYRTSKEYRTSSAHAHTALLAPTAPTHSSLAGRQQCSVTQRAREPEPTEGRAASSAASHNGLEQPSRQTAGPPSPQSTASRQKAEPTEESPRLAHSLQRGDVQARADPAQVREVADERAPKGLVDLVLDAVLLCDAHHDGRDCGVVRVDDSREEVVDDLVVEAPAEVGPEERVVAKVGRRRDLLLRPAAWHHFLVVLLQEHHVLHHMRDLQQAVEGKQGVEGKIGVLGTLKLPVERGHAERIKNACALRARVAVRHTVDGQCVTSKS